jgi:beta-galactosidase
VIDADADLTPYRLVIAPMLYMVRDGFAARAEAFDLFRPDAQQIAQRAREAAEIAEIGFVDDAGPVSGNLVQGLAGNQCGLQGPYQVRHLCELIHTESAQTLAVIQAVDLFRPDAQQIAQRAREAAEIAEIGFVDDDRLPE